MKLDNHELPHLISGVCLEVHRELGAGLPDVVYRDCLAREMRMRELIFERNKPLPILYRGGHIDSSEIILDFVVEDRLVLLIDSEDPAEAGRHIDARRELATYLRLSGLTLGLWVNFGEPDLRRGIRRMAISPERVTGTAIGAGLSRN